MTIASVMDDRSKSASIHCDADGEAKEVEHYNESVVSSFSETDPNANNDDDNDDDDDDDESFEESCSHETSHDDGEADTTTRESYYDGTEVVNYEDETYQLDDYDATTNQEEVKVADNHSNGSASEGYSEACQLDLGVNLPRGMLDVESLMMAAFSSVSIFPRSCAACGDDERIYYRKYQPNEQEEAAVEGSYDLGNSTIQTESIHQIDDGEWKTQYQEDQNAMASARAEDDYPDFQTVESTIPSVDIDDAGANHSLNGSTVQPKITARDVSVLSSGDDEVRADHGSDEVAYKVPDTNIDPSPAEVSLPGRERGALVEHSKDFCQRSRSAPPASSSKVTGGTQKAESSILKVGERNEDVESKMTKVAKQKRRRSARGRTSRSRSRARHRAIRDRKARRSRSETPTVSKTSSENKRGGKGLLRLFRPSSRKVGKGWNVERFQSPTNSTRRQQISNSERTKGSNRKGKSTEKPGRVSHEKSESIEKGDLSATPHAWETRDPLADLGPLALKELIKEELRDQYSCVASKSTASLNNTNNHSIPVEEQGPSTSKYREGKNLRKRLFFPWRKSMTKKIESTDGLLPRRHYVNGIDRETKAASRQGDSVISLGFNASQMESNSHPSSCSSTLGDKCTLSRQSQLSSYASGPNWDTEELTVESYTRRRDRYAEDPLHAQSMSTISSKDHRTDFSPRFAGSAFYQAPKHNY